MNVSRDIVTWVHFSFKHNLGFCRYINFLIGNITGAEMMVFANFYSVKLKV